ncbi:MAG: cobaltochelatase subunit CobN [Actinomycetia bacterium]|nr:cobaltochelatase subunit CobN [Actinomycetes bacterium]
MEDECRLWTDSFAAAGIDLTSFSTADVESRQCLSEAASQVQRACQNTRPLLLFRFVSMEFFQEEFYKSLPPQAQVLPVGGEAMLLGVASVAPEHVEAVNRYLLNSGAANIANAGLYLRKHLLGEADLGEVPEPLGMPFDGILGLETRRSMSEPCHCGLEPQSFAAPVRENAACTSSQPRATASTAASLDQEAVYGSLQQYFDARTRRFSRYVGLLLHRSQWLRGDMSAPQQLVAELEGQGIGTILAFSSADANSLGFGEICDRYFSVAGELQIELLVNLQLFSTRAEAGRSLREQAVWEYSRLGIPVLNPVQSFFLTAEQWRAAHVPLVADMPSALIAPEMAGGIEPAIIATLNSDDGYYQALPERVSFLAGRIGKLVALRSKPNAEKKIVVMLHNSVCSGVEATIGKGYGLDCLTSVVRLFERLQAAGYDLGEYPHSGQDLLALLMEKKAFSDFRWTAVEDIVAAGGCLYLMPAAGEYEGFFAELPEELQRSMLATWGEYPGEGLVYQGGLVVTGLAFGNVTLMVQPKRGCYGAKCTGEVCKILHDPACPPPHQYLASYRYIERVLEADALIDMGTDGSLEYLPGKANGLSELCWPTVVLGFMPSIYIYHTGVVNESLIVKRRMHSVISGHLPPPSRGADDSQRQLLRRIDDYFQAKSMANSQAGLAEQEIRLLLEGVPGAERIMGAADGFEAGLLALADAIHAIDQAQNVSSLHVLGQVPDAAAMEDYIREVCYGDGCEYDPEMPGADQIRAGLLQTAEELEMVLRALDGGYLPSGESGMPDENGRNILPTGRNIFGLNIDKVPSRTAYQRGQELAEQLLECYRQDEGKLPEQVAMNMISLDVTRTNGEQLSQFLYLLGVRPLWDRLGRVIGLEAIGLEELGRPRIDVTVRISGVLRDTWPTAVAMMDSAVLVVAALDEDDSQNYVLKHCRQATVGAAVDGDGGCSGLAGGDERRGTVRVFGDAPGTYGAGVDLALLASAWKDESDLAKYFIDASAFAYGQGLDGQKRVSEFIAVACRADLTCDTTSSRRVNSVSENFGVQVQGGFRLVGKCFANKDVRQYQSTSECGRQIVTEPLSDNLHRNIESTLLNAFWQQSIQERGYDGASDLMFMMQSVFSAQCVTDSLADELLDRLAEQYVNDEQMREWLAENNRFALEEISRRLLELYTRGKWRPDEDVLERLKANYLVVEGEMEEGLESAGEIQAGNLVIQNDADVQGWHERLAEVEQLVSERAAQAGAAQQKKAEFAKGAAQATGDKVAVQAAGAPPVLTDLTMMEGLR